ncbi:hypothetical protein Y88_3431 [Novosphingobium nitrogenifigens DSM 19370]|uniref:Uncharacterized protein n=1 Tax=Novosphingobium nitrogenifigens DSM 19370 TaxID=983920 RepID=F1Z388_9SPHN|nr:hypothetical protein Y88_3431 [Novosphingobium nitrogenifigens DSM 19370]
MHGSKSVSRRHRTAWDKPHAAGGIVARTESNRVGTIPWIATRATT